MSRARRALRRFPGEWFRTEEFVPQGGSEPREAGFNRPSHASLLMTGLRRALLAKPKDPILPDQQVFFAATTWKNRPSLRRNLDRLRARVHRVLPDGAVVASWSSRADYDDSKSYIEQYARKRSATADLDFIESIKGLDYRDKLGKSLLEVLEKDDSERLGLLQLVYYPQYAEADVRRINSVIADTFGPRGLVLQKTVVGAGRVSSTWHGPLVLSEEIARRVEAVAIVEQVGQLRPASRSGSAGGGANNFEVVVGNGLPEVAVFDTGVQASHPCLQGVVLSGDPACDLVDVSADGGHGTFVAGVVAFGEDPLVQTDGQGKLRPRAVVHSRRVELGGIPGGLNLDCYEAFSEAVRGLRSTTKVFTASFSQEVPIDSDSVSPQALNIDLVAERFRVLFVLPMGNLPNFVDGALSPEQPDYLRPSDWFADPNARMGRPGEAFNAITVASYAERQVGQEHAPPGHATIYCRRGPGPKLMPKPDLAEAGGNCVLRLDPDDPSVVELDVDGHAQSALTGLHSPAGTHKSFGTSFAVPKVAFSLAKLCGSFAEAGETETALLAKAYLIHVCSCPTGGPYPEEWDAPEIEASRHLLYGHGVPNAAALDGVTASEVCFYAATTIGRRTRHVYGLDLPTEVLNALPGMRLRVTLTYFTRVNAEALDAELYSLVELTPVVRWGGKTLVKLPRGGPLTEYYPLKSFDVRFSRPRDGEPADRGQPTVEVTMKDRATEEDALVQPYAIVISLIGAEGELLVNDLVQELDQD